VREAGAERIGGKPSRHIGRHLAAGGHFPWGHCAAVAAAAAAVGNP